MNKYFKIIGISAIVILLLVSLYYIFYGRTVEVFHPFYRTGEHYSKNKFNVFYEVTAGRGCDNCQKYDKKRRIVEADPSTFEVLNRNYTRDKNNFYICSWTGPDLFRITTKCEKIYTVDRDSFKPVDNESVTWYAKDKDHVYFFGTVIENADPQSFQIIDYDYAVDKNRIYYTDNHDRFHIVKEIKGNSGINEFFSGDHEVTEENMRNKLTPTINPFIEY